MTATEWTAPGVTRSCTWSTSALAADAAEEATEEGAQDVGRAAQDAREAGAQMDVPEQNIELFRKYEADIKKYAMGGLEWIGL